VEPRMPNPATLIPDANKAIQEYSAAVYKTGVDPKLLSLIHLRTSQINGCSVCTYNGATGAEKHGETVERIATVAAWRDAPFFTDAERAVLNLTEHVTRMADRMDPVPDEVYEAAAKHFDEKQLAAVILWIAMSNVFNRLNGTTRQVAGAQSW
jgi:AhpD family alkylhydroperoxidase